MNPLIIVGAGGHAGVIIDAAHLCGFTIRGLLDDIAPVGSVMHDLEVLGGIDDFLKPYSYSYFLAIGDNASRENVWKRMWPFQSVTITHPTACISPVAKYGEGCFFAAGSFVGPGCVIGPHCIVNTHAILDHDSKLGGFSHLAPNCATGGHVTIGRVSFIGIGASVRDRVTIGDNCTIGMGSVVVKNVPDNATVYGNPARAK